MFFDWLSHSTDVGGWNPWVPVELLLSILAELALSIFAERIAELLLCVMA
jgi:hypothetical protein